MNGAFKIVSVLAILGVLSGCGSSDDGNNVSNIPAPQGNPNPQVPIDPNNPNNPNNPNSPYWYGNPMNYANGNFNNGTYAFPGSNGYTYFYNNYNYMGSCYGCGNKWNYGGYYAWAGVNFYYGPWSVKPGKCHGHYWNH